MKPIDLIPFLNKARNILRYYRVGPLGDVPSINGKLVEEALRKVMVDAGLGKVSTSGNVDLGVSAWGAGIQLKTYRKKSKTMIFSRSDKATKGLRIIDIKNRIVDSLKRTHTKELYLLDVDTFTSDFSLYLLARVLPDGTLKTFGTFLQSDSVRVNLSQTHFVVDKAGLKKIA